MSYCYRDCASQCVNARIENCCCENNCYRDTTCCRENNCNDNCNCQTVTTSCCNNEYFND